MRALVFCSVYSATKKSQVTVKKAMIFCPWICYFVSFLPRNFRLLCRQTWWWIICKSRKRMVVSASKPADKENQFIFVRPIEGDWLVVANKPFLEFQKLWLLNEANCKTFRVKTSFIYAWKSKLIFISVASHFRALVWNSVLATRKWPVEAFCESSSKYDGVYYLLCLNATWNLTLGFDHQQAISCTTKATRIENQSAARSKINASFPASKQK